ncbi:MAG: UvrD-helicase domain-containing protein [Rhodocyclaceae bacterium]|nr:UvrD-helicase domain-containing protein [Rhodocyclaceae bacterium]
MSSVAKVVIDQDERLRALDVGRSFIVRAPAGSGKTRLLIQRYLALLVTVDEPEEVIAITFTRKAAAEMRARVLSAFAGVSEADGDAVVGDAPTRALATQVLARDAERNWQLLANSARLRIQTIDSLNTSLTRQMPMMSRFGAQPESVDDASVLYRRAARQLISQINDDDPVADDIATLLTHLDNNLGVVEALIADMLRGRDHWLRNLPKMHQREALEAALSRVRKHAVAEVAALYPAIERSETLELVRFSGQNLLKESVDNALSRCANLDSFPSGALESLPAWLAIADLLLTKDGTWRKASGVNKNIGFPTSKIKREKALLDAMKTRIGALLESMAADDARGVVLANRLDALRALPPGKYTDAEWQVLGAIVRLLPHATAQLWDVFAAEGECDFTEIAQAASRALGSDDEPTDLALALDFRIRHLLVDEFQDTSFAQFELLEKLTRGWSPDDGRTLFVVGDPMQSIYRFREAEVGLFLRARRVGLGGVSLTPLTLSVNFRSVPGVVAWVNNTFSQLMPGAEDAATGLVPYARCVAFGNDGRPAEDAVSMHWTLVDQGNKSDAERQATASPGEIEAAKVVAIVRQTRLDKPNASIALLTRNRRHLGEIVPALKAAGIVFHAVDIDPLKDRPVVQDLFALTRALLHVADRIAWLAILRAPWCGLTLNDLAALTASVLPVDGALTPDQRTIWEMINDAARLERLSGDGRLRVEKLRDVLHTALQMRRRMPLRDAVEQCWLALSGPACLDATSDLDDAMTFLDLLETEAREQSGGAQIVSLVALQAQIDRLYSGGGGVGCDINNADDANRASTAPPIEIMTIHKAKGLEFDTVIVPGLDRLPRRDDKKLLVWAEQADVDTDGHELLLAPIRETGADDAADAIYQYITKLDQAKQQHEDIRLLYVAATRAERRLHFLATLAIKRNDGMPEVVAPKAASLLGSLWPALGEKHLPSVGSLTSAGVLDDSSLVATAAEKTPHVPRAEVTGPARLAIDFPLPLMVSAMLSVGTNAVGDGKPAEASSPQIDFEWATDIARHVGTAAHTFLQRIASDGLETWDAKRIDASRPLFQKELTRLGVGNNEVNAACDRIEAALNKTLADPRGRWTLTAHRGARSEWRLTGLVDGKLTNVALDRTFVDADGVRWIIDFKTGSHEGADVEAFLDNEQRRYSAQLEAYATLVHALSPEQNQIRLGLYFPMMGGWREWSWRGE